MTKKSKEKKQKPTKKEKKEVGNSFSKPKLNLKKVKLSPKALIIIGVLLLVTILVLSKDLFVAALVNGQPISRWKILKKSEEAQGGQILDSLVTDQLIKQEAQKQGIKINEDEVDQQIEEIKASIQEQGQDFDTLLSMQGMTLEDLKGRIRIQKMVEQLLGSEVEVADEEVDQYLEDNKEFLPEDMSEEEMKEQARQQLEQQKLSEKYQSWLDELKEKAKINYFVDYSSEE
jgi:parvulin-like peptidyl-prolyl isomerase